MDFYPQDLLVGVFPLVFAVNAILPSQDANAAAQQGHPDGHDQQQQQHHQRSFFERFLDVVVASLVDDGGEDGSDGKSGGSQLFSQLQHLVDSDGDDDFLETSALSTSGGGGSSSNKRRASHYSFYAGFGRRSLTQSSSSGPQQQDNMNASSAHSSYAKALTHGQGFFQRARIESVSTRHGFPPSKCPEGRRQHPNTNRNQQHNNNNNQQQQMSLSSSNNSSPGTRRRLLSPSSVSSSATAATASSWSSSSQFLPSLLPSAYLDPQDPELLKSLSGILPAGWLEKHVHALPSVILVVCTVTGSSQKVQAEQDALLLETIRHFQQSLVEKRHCKIHVVGLMDDSVSLYQGDEWNRAMTAQLMDDDTLMQPNGSGELSSSSSSVRITLLRSSVDLQSSDTGRPSSLAFRRLHQSVRDASLLYYHSQARRTRDKLAQFFVPNPNPTTLASSSTSTIIAAPFLPPPPPLLPLVIRYCFKIAIFYEFQYQFEKSLRYLAEAYRHCAKYLEYLLKEQEEEREQHQEGEQENEKAASAAGVSSEAVDSSYEVNDSDDMVAAAQRSVSPTVIQDTGDSLEVALVAEGTAVTSTSTKRCPWEAAVPKPRDRIHQCKAVAEWLNLKLLQAGFASHTEGGLLAAANQWRQHNARFCKTAAQLRLRRQRQQGHYYDSSNHKSSSSYSSSNNNNWHEWQYIARQRLVLSQLVERHPPKALGDLGNEYDEVLLRCSPWRTYESAVEATLQLARASDQLVLTNANARTSLIRTHGSSGTNVAASAASVMTIKKNEDLDVSPSRDPMRRPYVGSMDSDGLALELQETRKVNHRDAALQLVLRAISLYERELEKEKRGFYAEDHFRERSSSRAGARLYYLAGGILLGMERHEEAVLHLEKASRYCKGWRELELAIRRMLIECYEKHLPSSQNPSEESNQAIVSMILDSYFNAEMSSGDLRRALGQFASIRGAQQLTWYHETVDEEDTSLPVSFAVSFPGRTHATAGETVKASVLITSNLDYAIHVNSVVLQSLAGMLPIPSMDLSSAANASEGSEGGIIIQSKTSIMISTELELSTDTSMIAIDDSGNGGEMQGVAGKGSFAKSARPRSAGITSAGGARLVSEEELSHGNRVSQGWNLKYLGGKPLRCDGICVEFYPVQVEKSAGGAEDVTPIVLTIAKKKSKTQANIKRTPFEEENYLASAWSRPLHLPLSLGPRSLRVLGPMPDLLIKDMTEDSTGGKVLEGTVNRILLKLTAGPEERCCDIKYRVTCFSVLITPNGSTRRLVSELELTGSESSVNMNNPSFRTPALVAQADNVSTISDTSYGYALPQGWKLAGSGQAFSGPLIQSLSCGDSKYIGLDIYRPSPLIHSITPQTDDDSDIGEASLCKTDLYLTVSYRQERAMSAKVKRSNIRRSGLRRRPIMSSASHDESGESSSAGVQEQDPIEKDAAESSFDEVSLEFTGSVVWAKPLSASFRSGAMRSFPAGSRAPLNQVTNSPGQERGETNYLVDGENITTTCTFQVDSAVEGLKTEVLGVRFEGIDEPGVSVSLQSAGAVDRSDELYVPLPDNPCRLLSTGSKLSVAYTVKPRLKIASESAPVKASMGAIVVDWKPSPLPLPDDARLDQEWFGGIANHGPLRLETPSTLRFAGPESSIESSPFQVSIDAKPCAPRLGVPFKLAYRIANKTIFHQVISIQVKDYGDETSGLLFAGLAQGELALAPSEAQVISYTMLATRAGKAKLPSIEVVSSRHGSWIIKEDSNDVYVFP